jgi:hypothetical protein
MISAMRSKFGPAIIFGVMGVIVVVFVFSGIFTRSSLSGGPGVAGEVNGETITYSEFSRALNQRVEMLKGMLGGKVTEEQIAQFRISEAVFQDLAQRKVMVQMAKKEGFMPSPEQIREQIVKMDAFKKDGRFDKMQYKAVLAANQYTDVRFEELVAQDIMEQNFREFLGQLAHVSDREVESELVRMKTRAKVKYVYLDNESVRKLLPKNLKPEEQGKALNAKVAELTKEIVPALGKGADARIKDLLKEVKIQAKTSDWLSRESNVIPGVGSVRSIEDQILPLKKEDGVREFSLPAGTFIALSVASESFDRSKLTEKDRSETLKKLQGQRQQAVMSEFLRSFMKNAKVSRNDSVVVEGKGSAVPLTADLDQ